MYARQKDSRLWVLIGCLAFIGMGCTHIISESVRQQAQPPLSFAELRTNPEALKGRTVILGGESYKPPTYAKAHASRFCSGPWVSRKRRS